MLPITIPEGEYYDSEKNEFITIHEQKIRLEHSLVSISKWEAKFKKPFLTKDPKTHEETIEYIKMMTITQNVNPLAYHFLPDSVIKEVQDYIDDPMTATRITSKPKPGHREIITSELIYYWMTGFGIPFECEKWHLNRLLCLIEVCNAKNDKPKKMPRNEVYNNNKALNAARRAKSNSKG